MNYFDEINKLKTQKNALILGHYYLADDVQDIADYIGDSYGLAKKASEIDSDIIVFAGVKFMAETAKILNSDKKVLLANMDSGCPLADMVTGEDIRNARKKYNNLFVVCYVNSNAEVKAESDVCVTSRNAAIIVKNIDKKYENILFVPDKNLGHYVQQITGRKLILWDGFCCVHENLSDKKIDEIRKNDSEAVILAHPECRKEVLEKVDHAFSTSGMVNFAKENTDLRIYTATETGVLKSMKNYNSNVFGVSEKMICGNMKKITLQNIYDVLKNEINNIELSDEIMEKAYNPIKKMIEMTESEAVSK
ncbi:MAG: quinolinate synthase NadA [Candidatus Muiribacteriota bacterium]